MFASNFPVDKLTGTYAQVWRGFDAACARLSGNERAALFRDNAKNFYRIKD